LAAVPDVRCRALENVTRARGLTFIEGQSSGDAGDKSTHAAADDSVEGIRKQHATSVERLVFGEENTFRRRTALSQYCCDLFH